MEGDGEIVFDAKPGRGVYKLEAEKSYNPAKEGQSEDQRDLTFIINSINWVNQGVNFGKESKLHYFSTDSPMVEKSKNGFIVAYNP